VPDWNLLVESHIDRGPHKAPQVFGVPETPVGIETHFDRVVPARRDLAVWLKRQISS
jgi:hypothetical protein